MGTVQRGLCPGTACRTTCSSDSHAGTKSGSGCSSALGLETGGGIVAPWFPMLRTGGILRWSACQ